MRISEKKLKEIEFRHLERKSCGLIEPQSLSDFDELFKAVVEHQDDDRDILLEMTARFVVAMMTSQGMPAADVGDAALSFRAVRLARDVFQGVDIGGDR